MTETVHKSRLLQEQVARQEAEKLLEQKALELSDKNEALQKLTDSLEQKVIERTIELEKARDEALSANRLKSAFLANMSHEIRTPLTAVIGFAENIQAGIVAEDDVPGAVNNIVRNSRHLLSVLNEILDISKIESGQLDIEQTRFSVSQLLNEIESIFKGLCQEKGLYFDLERAPNLPADILSDPTRIRQILMNLLGNAVKFTESGRISLTVKFAKAEQQLSFIIRDTGIGMDKAQIQQLFQPFTQADSSITRKFGGTGLGLSISKDLAVLLGGDIQVESAPGRGAVFTFTTVCSEVFQDSIVDLQKLRTKNWAPLSGKVLVVEDNDMNQQLIAQNLTAAGLEYQIECNGEEGYQAALAGDFDLILMDIQMPVMDGKEAIGILRAVGFNSPIVALTANVLPQDVTEYRQLGFNQCLAKPIERDKFYQVLASYLEAAEESNADKNPRLEIDNLDEIQDKFLKRLPDYKEKLQDAVKEQNHKSAEGILHQLKGLCGNFHFDSLSKQVEQAYNHIRTNELAHCQQDISLVIDEINRLSHQY